MLLNDPAAISGSLSKITELGPAIITAKYYCHTVYCNWYINIIVFHIAVTFFSYVKLCIFSTIFSVNKYESRVKIHIGYRVAHL